jgi:hypothetical protein
MRHTLAKTNTEFMQDLVKKYQGAGEEWPASRRPFAEFRQIVMDQAEDFRVLVQNPADRLVLFAILAYGFVCALVVIEGPVRNLVSASRNGYFLTPFFCNQEADTWMVLCRRKRNS